MKTINVTFQEAENKKYSIIIGNGLIEKISTVFDFAGYSKALIVTDDNIKPLLLEKLSKALKIDSVSFILPPGENEKNIESVQKIWAEMKNAGCDRKSVVINLGGGVIGDMGGFAASTYMRGIDFINIPTTLLSQVDASIGGKTGIDFAGIKNMIGTFNQPRLVIIDVQTLKTLPDREFISGFAEIIKHGLILDKDYIELVTSKKPRDFSSDGLIGIIDGSCRIKKEIVENDPTEINLRKLLNFGHTIGHAIESLSLETSEPLLHGEAISIGMIAEAKISELNGLVSHEELELIKHELQNAGLPTSISGIKTTDVMGKMALDKKNDNGKINFTLLKSIGNAIYDQNVSKDLITQSLEYITK